MGISPLLLLTKGGKTLAVLERVVTQLERARKPEALAILRLLAMQVFRSNQEMIAWIEWRFTSMHDSWIEESLMYKELVQKGEIKGISIGQRLDIEAVVKARFPDLLDLVRARVEHIHGEQQLRDILLQLVTVPTEAEAHRFLMSLPE